MKSAEEAPGGYAAGPPFRVIAYIQNEYLGRGLEQMLRSHPEVSIRFVRPDSRLAVCETMAYDEPDLIIVEDSLPCLADVVRSRSTTPVAMIGLKHSGIRVYFSAYFSLDSTQDLDRALQFIRQLKAPPSLPAWRQEDLSAGPG